MIDDEFHDNFYGVKNLPNIPYCASHVLPEWVDLVQNLVNDLNKLIPGAWQIAQIKEKYWGLRFYVEYDSEFNWEEEPRYPQEKYNKADELIARAEEESYNLLERN